MLNMDIVNYVERHILPLYDSFDKGHDSAHVGKVIDDSLVFASEFDVDMDMVYVIAAYHDVGLSRGRQRHEASSAAFLLEDANLREWFAEEQIRIMAEAVEDHRASTEHEPRGIYGKIVAEADRDMDYMSALSRTIQYSMKHYPDYDKEAHFTRVYTHLCEKFGEGGYARLWLNTEKRRNELAELRRTLAAAEGFRADFDRLFATMQGYSPPT